MVDLTIYLNKKLNSDLDTAGIERNVSFAIEQVYTKGVKVRVSQVGTNKPAELIFNEMSPVDLDDLEEIVDAAAEALIFSINSLDGKKIGITIHPVIIYEYEGDVL